MSYSKDHLTIKITITRQDGGPMYPPVEHTYKDRKAAHEDYELLGKMLKKFGSLPGS